MFPAPQIPPERFPPRLAGLGYVAAVRSYVPSDSPVWGLTAANSINVEVITPPMCAVPGGPCLVECGEHEHWVTLEAFEIARYPVTVAEYAAYLRATGKQPNELKVPWSKQASQLDVTIVGVPLDECETYAQWLSKATGETWSVPTEQEWERAAYWDESSRRLCRYPWGDVEDPRGSERPYGISPCGALGMVNYAWEWAGVRGYGTTVVLRGGPADLSPGQTAHRRIVAQPVGYQPTWTDASGGKELAWDRVGFRLVRHQAATEHLPGHHVGW